MNTYTIKVKQIFTTKGVEAKNRKEAIQKVLKEDWQDHIEDDQLEPLEVEAIKIINPTLSDLY